LRFFSIFSIKRFHSKIIEKTPPLVFFFGLDLVILFATKFVSSQSDFPNSRYCDLIFAFGSKENKKKKRALAAMCRPAVPPLMGRHYRLAHAGAASSRHTTQPGRAAQQRATLPGQPTFALRSLCS
jgi:hypothetical protein